MKNVVPLFEEFVDSDFDALDSFDIKTELNPSVWESTDRINSEVRNQLLKVATDFYSYTELDIEIKDIILTGSLANYNWDIRYSDFDLHIIIDFNDAQMNKNTFKKYVDSLKSIWNLKHNIKILSFEVEVYIQDINEIHTATGVYSLYSDKWLVKPTYMDITIGDDIIRLKAESIMFTIDTLEKELETVNKYNYENFINNVNDVLNKVKKYRIEGLSENNGEFSVGNLTFKLLRRNGYIGRLLKMKTDAYDKQFQ